MILLVLFFPLRSLPLSSSLFLFCAAFCTLGYVFFRTFFLNLYRKQARRVNVGVCNLKWVWAYVECIISLSDSTLNSIGWFCSVFKLYRYICHSTWRDIILLSIRTKSTPTKLDKHTDTHANRQNNLQRTILCAYWNMWTYRCRMCE